MKTNLIDLPIDDKLRLVEDLWDSIAIEQNAIPLTEAQKTELNKRLDAYSIDIDPGRSAIEAVAEIRKKL